MRLDQLFKEDETTVKTMSMPEKVAAFDRLQPGQEIGLWFDSVIRRADKYKPFVVGRKTKSKFGRSRPACFLTHEGHEKGLLGPRGHER